MNQIYVVTGTTCVGKTPYAIDLAHSLEGECEILCMDAFQVYSHMPILSAAPSLNEREQIKHSLFEYVNPTQSYSLKEYYDEVTLAIQGCWKSQKTPILVGGTGLYLRVLRQGLESSNALSHPEFRDELEALAQQHGREHIHSMLEKIDPKRASELHPNDLKRVIRALEIHRFSQEEKQTRDELQAFCPKWHIYCLQASRELLYTRMDKRVLQMIEAGVEQEVQSLLEMGVRPGMTSYQAIGLKETASYLNGEVKREQWIEIFMRNTRRFAKRQGTWWRSMQGIEIIDRENEIA